MLITCKHCTLLVLLLAGVHLHGIIADLTATPAGTFAIGTRNWRDSRQPLRTLSQSTTTCTNPLPAVAGKPYCVVPATVSAEAQNILKIKAPGAAPDPLDVGSAALRRVAFNNQSAPLSAAAAEKYLQSVRNDTLDGVPVTVGIPKTMNVEGRNKMILHLHGGAYVYGSCQYYWHVSSLVSYTAGIPVTCVEYSLAPDSPFPAGLNDALAVYKTLIKQYKPRNIVIMGDSAGGGLSLALTLKLKQEGLPLPGTLVLMSPWSDLEKTGDTMTTLTGVDPQLQYELNLQRPAHAYVGGDETLFANPLVSPLRADFSTPWPNTYIQVGLRDSFLSACTMLYRKLRPLRAQGVDIEFSPWEGMYHIFSGALNLPEAVAANIEMAEFIKMHVGRK